ncbi:MAG TPA: FliM/FliN family flagellar motor switch protein [Terracidiphilus sp.]|jgi:flagellar motor switch protein FliM
MSNSDQAKAGAQSAVSADQKTVYSCNFRSAGRLSNENARSLTHIHEGLARHLASALDSYLGTDVEVKLSGIEQIAVKDHVAAISPLTYMVPFSLNNKRASMILECDVELVFPVLDLLLGGVGGTGETSREVSELEEEVMSDVVSLIVRQAETSWHMPAMSVVQNRRIRSTVLHQYCVANEKVTVARFDIGISGVGGFLNLVFPNTFLNVLIQQIKLDQPQRRGGVRFFPGPTIRERILDSDIQVATELQGLRVAVRDLIGLQPATVLKLRTPVGAPGVLTASGRPIFEATPVRNGSQKAAQLGRKVPMIPWETK